MQDILTLLPWYFLWGVIILGVVVFGEILVFVRCDDFREDLQKFSQLSDRLKDLNQSHEIIQQMRRLARITVSAVCWPYLFVRWVHHRTAGRTLIAVLIALGEQYVSVLEAKHANAS
ncbi:MAG: hypothetical protein Q7S02_02175 [bacterium]|nr:hypothetical protein [bacterium]